MRRKVKRSFSLKPDPVYKSDKIAQFINHVMLDGKKVAARKIVYGAFDIVKEKTKTDSVEVFETALKNTGPTVEVRSRRIGGANYQVPREVRPERRNFLAMTWIINAARSKSGKSMDKILADEIISAYNNEGDAVTKKENTHKMAEANKAFAHFSW